MDLELFGSLKQIEFPDRQNRQRKEFKKLNTHSSIDYVTLDHTFVKNYYVIIVTNSYSLHHAILEAWMAV
jgi:hypothetical protein